MLTPTNIRPIPLIPSSPPVSIPVAVAETNKPTILTNIKFSVLIQRMPNSIPHIIAKPKPSVPSASPNAKPIGLRTAPNGLSKNPQKSPEICSKH